MHQVVDLTRAFDGGGGDAGDAVNFGYPDRCFFTVGKSAKGTWWFIDPNGTRFLSNGVDVVNYGGDSTATGTPATRALPRGATIETKLTHADPRLLFLSLDCAQARDRTTMQ
jgi:hypothetical protein